LTQQDLADALDVARTTVVSLESAAPSPQLDHLIRALHLVGYELLAVPADHPLAREALIQDERVPARVDRHR
jgi:DNA-binding XRE family transcriptional regulator